MKTVPSLGSIAGLVKNEMIEHASGDIDFDISSQLTCAYHAYHRVLWSTWMPLGIPSFNLDLLRDLERASELIEARFADQQDARRLDYIVLRSAVEGAFNVGGDLGYFQRLIAAQDRVRLAEYARAAINVVYRNYTSHNLSGVTSIALLEGDALGGGLECALSCDVVIAERDVQAGFPEVLFNMFPGMGGLSFLARRVGHRTADEMVRTGRLYSADELLALGVIDQVVEKGQGAQAIKKLIARRRGQVIAHNAMNAVDRIVRPLSLQELYDVVKIWVDSALRLDGRSLQWMQRIYQRQIAIFGKPLELASITTRARPSAAAA